MDIRQQATERIHQLIKKGNMMFKAKVKLDSIKFKNIKVEWGTIHGQAGWNQDDGWYLELNLPSLEMYPEWMLEEVIPHEVAHNIAHWLYVQEKPFGDKDHGKSWKMIAKALGSSGIVHPHPPNYRRHVYVTSAGNRIRLGDIEHDKLQNQYKVLRDKHENKITAAGYVKTLQ